MAAYTRGVRDLAGFISTLITIEVILIIIRVALSWFPEIDPWNPAVRALRAVVDPVLYPFRRMMPTFSGIDLSPILAIVVLDQVRQGLDDYRANLGISATRILGDIVATLILDIIIVFIIIMLLRVIISMFHADPFHPLVRMVRDISAPLVRPFASALPRSRAIDTPAVLALGVFLIMYFVVRAILSEVVKHL